MSDIIQGGSGFDEKYHDNGDGTFAPYQAVIWAQQLDEINDSITAYPFGGSYVNITTSTTTTVKSGSGVLQDIIVGDPGTTWQAVLYDNTAGSGTIIATIKFGTSGVNLPKNVAFSTGLTIVTSGTTAGNITPVYR